MMIKILSLKVLCQLPLVLIHEKSELFRILLHEICYFCNQKDKITIEKFENLVFFSISNVFRIMLTWSWSCITDTSVLSTFSFLSLVIFLQQSSPCHHVCPHLYFRPSFWWIFYCMDIININGGKLESNPWKIE